MTRLRKGEFCFSRSVAICWVAALVPTVPLWFDIQLLEYAIPSATSAPRQSQKIQMAIYFKSYRRSTGNKATRFSKWNLICKESTNFWILAFLIFVKWLIVVRLLFWKYLNNEPKGLTQALLKTGAEEQTASASSPSAMWAKQMASEMHVAPWILVY